MTGPARIDHPELGTLVEPHELRRLVSKPTVCRFCMAPAAVHPTVIYAVARESGDRRNYWQATRRRRLTKGRS